MNNNDKPGRFGRLPKKAWPVAGPGERGERLQKILAHAGVASRRAAEELISSGRVSVNGEVVTEMGVRADPSTDKIEVDGRALHLPEALPGGTQSLVYIALNKPVGVVSTASDPQGRPTVLDMVKGQVSGVGGRGSGVGDQRPGVGRQRSAGPASDLRPPTPYTRHLTPDTLHPTPTQRVYPVGRLDVDTTGLLLLTNDGELTFRVTHPRYGIEKEYRVLVRGRPGAEAVRKLQEGVEIEGELTSPAKVDYMGAQEGNSWLRVVIHEGRKRQVRLMTAAVGHPALELQRVRFGPITLGSLEVGKWRYLATHEVHALRKAVKLDASGPSASGSPVRSSRPSSPRKPGGPNNPVRPSRPVGPGRPKQANPTDKRVGKAPEVAANRVEGDSRRGEAWQERGETGGTRGASGTRETRGRPERAARPASPTRPARPEKRTRVRRDPPAR